MFLGFDPGKDKCGLAVMGMDRKLHLHTVVTAGAVLDRIQELLHTYPISLLVMGDCTSAKTWKAQMHQRYPDLRIVTVDESYSSQEARQRYWQMYPPTGLARLVPEGMRLPPRPIDDLAAIILIERYLSRLIS